MTLFRGAIGKTLSYVAVVLVATAIAVAGVN